MKKILLAVVVVVLVALFGVQYFVKSQISNNISDTFAFADVKEKSKSSGFSSTKGVIEGVITAQNIKQNFVKSMRFVVPNLNEKESLELFENEDFKDIKFEYEYEIKHGILGIMSGYESNGKIRITSPEIEKELKEIFGTNEIATIKSNTNATGDTKFNVKMTDIDKIIDGEKVKVQNFAIGGDLLGNGKRANNISIKLDKLNIGDEKTQISVDDIEAKTVFAEDLVIENTQNIMDLILRDSQSEGFVKNIKLGDENLSATLNELKFSQTYTKNGENIADEASYSLAKISSDELDVENFSLKQRVIYPVEMIENLLKIAYSGDANIEKQSEILIENFMNSIQKQGFEANFDLKADVNKLEDTIKNKTKINGELLIGFDKGIDFKNLNLFNLGTLLEKLNFGLKADITSKDIKELIGDNQDELIKLNGETASIDMKYDKTKSMITINGDEMSIEEFMQLFM